MASKSYNAEEYLHVEGVKAIPEGMAPWKANMQRAKNDKLIKEFLVSTVY